HRALQGARRGFAALGAPLTHADGLRDRLGGARLGPALATARYQTAVRILLDRAHGARHFRVRHGRGRRDVRGVTAHDGAFAHQVSDFLCDRTCRTEGGLAEDGGHPRTRHAFTDGRLGIDARYARDTRVSAVRRI